MAEKSLAVKYRPKTFEDVTEQGATRTILEQQLASGNIKNAYLFCGAAGCGKTTCARIFANAINKGEGNPIELDAASNNSVDDVREIIQMAQTRSMDSEYKVFILDEVHVLSNSAWQAMLKLIEEPPLKSIFIFCTTDPQKIPKTIMSRVQRYDFKRISHQGIVHRLQYIFATEYPQGEYGYEDEAIYYVAKLSDGCMREAITMMEKCIAFSKELTVENVIQVLGVQNHGTFMRITDALINHDSKKILDEIADVYSSGVDMKQFEKQYLDFILDVSKYFVTDSFSYTSLPPTDEMKKWIDDIQSTDDIADILDMLIELQSAIRWDPNPRFLIEAKFLTLKLGE